MKKFFKRDDVKLVTDEKKTIKIKVTSHLQMPKKSFFLLFDKI